MAKLLAVAVTLFVGTADCERGFSEMKKTKTDLRNRMKTQTLDQLMTPLRNWQRYLAFTSRKKSGNFVKNCSKTLSVKCLYFRAIAVLLNFRISL